MPAIKAASFAEGFANGLNNGVNLGVDIKRARQKAISDANELESARQDRDIRKQELEQSKVKTESTRIANDEARQKAAAKAKATTAMLAIGGDTGAATAAMTKILRADMMTDQSAMTSNVNMPKVTGVKTIDSSEGLIPDVEFVTEDGQTHKWGRPQILSWMTEAYGEDHVAVVDGNKAKGIEAMTKYQSELTDQLNSIGSNLRTSIAENDEESARGYKQQYDSLLKTLGVVNERVARMQGLELNPPPAPAPQPGQGPGGPAVSGLPPVQPGNPMTEEYRRTRAGGAGTVPPTGGGQPAISSQPGAAPQGQGAIAAPGQQPAATPAYTKTIRNPTTGEVIGLLNGAWYDVRTGQPYQNSTTSTKTL